MMPAGAGDRSRTRDNRSTKPELYQLSYTSMWSWNSELNREPTLYESVALPIELFQRIPPSFRGVSAVAFGAPGQWPESNRRPWKFCLSTWHHFYQDEALPTELHCHKATIGSMAPRCRTEAAERLELPGRPFPTACRNHNKSAV